MAESVMPHGRPAKKPKTAHGASIAPTNNAVKAKADSKVKNQSRAKSAEDVGEEPSGNKADALAALEAHSRMMLGLMGGGDVSDDDQGGNRAESSSMALRRGNKRSNGVSRFGADEDSSENETEDEDDDGEGFTSDDGWGAEDGMVTDSEEEDIMQSSSGKGKGKRTGTLPAPAPPIVVPEVVFADMGGSMRRDESMTKAERKAFMSRSCILEPVAEIQSGKSSKIMGIAPEHITTSRKRSAQNAAEDLEDATNSSLDTTLHKMLLQNLLPSATASDASRPVDKRNAMSGRLLELAQISLPGEGTSTLPSAMHSRHSAKIRTGIIHAKAKRDEKAREASEAAGSWVRGKGGLGDIGKRGTGVGGVKGKDDRLALGEMVKKKGMSGGKKGVRERGLDASVGKFEKGSLRVDAKTIARVERQSQKSGPVMPKGKGKGKKGW